MASKFLGIFGGKQAPGGLVPVSPVPPPPEPPSAPAQNTPSQLIGGGRRRVTQRLVLGGKGGASSTPETGRIKLPGAMQPEGVIPDLGMVDGTVEMPLLVLLRCFPSEFLNVDPDGLGDDPVAQEHATLPLSSILPQLPSGKVEFAAADLAAYLPAEWVRSAAELGEYAGYGIQIPLPDLIQRIHPDYLSLRSDQKPIDNNVVQMTDPFTPEQLMAAQAKAKAAAAPMVQEIAGDTPEEAPVEDIPETEEEAGSAVPEAEEETADEVQDAPPEPGPMESYGEAQEAEPEEAFTQSEEFQNFLRQTQEEEAAKAAGAWAQPAGSVDEFVEGEGEATTEVPVLPALDYDFPEEAPTQVMEQEAAPLPAEEEGPEFAPTRPLERLPVAALPAFSFKVPSPAVPVPAAEEPEPGRSGEEMETKSLPVVSGLEAARGVGVHSSIRFSRTLALRLRYQPEEEVSLRELLHRMSTWPGMKGCILGGRDGLTISAETQDTRAANTLSAFAPKIMGRVSELFRDLGYEEINELQTTTREGSVFIFRQTDLFFISLFDGTSLPAGYRELIGQTLEELSRWHHSNA